MLGNIISYFFVCLQKFNTNVVSSTFFYNDYINKRKWNKHYLQFTAPDLLSKYVVYIPTNINENHWLILVILALARTVISIGSLSYEKIQFWILLCFFKICTIVPKISFNEEHWKCINHQGILKQKISTPLWYIGSAKCFRNN